MRSRRSGRHFDGMLDFVQAADIDADGTVL